MAKQRRPPADVTARRERVWEQTCSGLTVRKIAAIEGVDPSQITRDLAALHAEMDARTEDAIERRKQAANEARGLYRTVISKALTAFDRSTQDKLRKRRKSKTKGKLGKDGKPVSGGLESEDITEGQAGDAAHLMVAVRARARIDAIEGVDAPKDHNVKVSGAVGLRNMTEEELDRHIDRLERELGRSPGGAKNAEGGEKPS